MRRLVRCLVLPFLIVVSAACGESVSSNQSCTIETPTGSVPCSERTGDGGRACSDSSECEGYCDARAAEPGTSTRGACSTSFDRPACFREVVGGVATPTICE